MVYAYFLVFDRQDRIFGLEFYRARKEKILAKIFGRTVLIGAENT
jgi:hypothetical protein